MRLLFLLIVSDGGVFMVVSDGGVVIIFVEGLVNFIDLGKEHS